MASHCQCPQQSLFLNGCPTPMKTRSIPFKVQIGHNLIKSFCFNLRARRPGTAGTSPIKPERPCEESSPPHYVQVAVELLIWNAFLISLTSIPVSHSFDHGIAYISEIVNSESTKQMQPINRKDRSPVVKSLASSRQKHGTETDHVIIRFLLFFLLLGSSRTSIRSRSFSNRRGSNGECFGIRKIFFDLEQSFKGVGKKTQVQQTTFSAPSNEYSVPSEIASTFLYAFTRECVTDAIVG